ncbi:LIC_10705 family lipoprotein, partial [Leptospira interrogans]
PTEEIPILEPGTYTRYMSEGDTYIFDNRARLNTPYQGHASEYFTFIIQENAEQEIKLISPVCGTSPDFYSAKGDSGTFGHLETLYISLRIPESKPQNRYGYFTKLKAVSGSGTITFTTPTVQDPPR